MTAFNYVTMTGQWTDGVHFANGNYLFNCSGDLMDNSDTAITSPVIIGQLDSLGSLSVPPAASNTGVPLLASDNFQDGQLTYHFLVRVAGYPTIDVADIVVDFTAGATQGIFAILEANGWTPITT